MQEINKQLYRELKNDYPEDIFPKVECKSTHLGEGDTFFSVEKINEMIQKYSFQCKKISQKLKHKSQEKTMYNLHQFLYWHFQYKADAQLQQLRSPACSWKQRKQGIDCKSYTILAGAILKQLGYHFYIRQVKQLLSPYPDEFSHVYVIVPKDQKQASLNKGYYTIDATIPTMKELSYIIPSDFLVMKHIALNAPAINPLLTSVLPYGSSNSGVYSDLNGNTYNNTTTSTNRGKGWRTAKNILELVKDLGGAGQALGIIKTQGGRQILPAHIRTEDQFNQFIRNISQNNNPQNENTLNQLLPILMANLNNRPPEPEKKDYTPYIIGGVGVAVLLVMVVMMDNKKR